MRSGVTRKRTESHNKKLAQAMRKAWQEGRHKGMTGRKHSEESRELMAMSGPNRLTDRHKFMIGMSMRGNKNAIGPHNYPENISRAHPRSIRKALLAYIKDRIYVENYEHEGRVYDFYIVDANVLIDIVSDIEELDDTTPEGYAYIQLVNNDIESVLSDI